MMRTIRWGRTELQVPAISLGTWPHSGPSIANGTEVGWTGHDDDLAVDALEACWRAGITHWDTADVYGDGNAESLIGKVWDRVPRDEIVVASKVGWNAGDYGHFYHPELMRERLERSLKLMKVEAIDVYYLHHCLFGEDGDERYFEGALETVRSFQREGKIRFIGLSDWDATRIMRFIERVDPDVVQPYRNLLDDAFVSSGLKAHVDANDIGVAFFSPLQHGLLLGKYDSPTTFGEGDWRNGVDRFRDQAVISSVKKAAEGLPALFAGHDQPVLHGVVDTLLQDAPTATALVGLRNPDQVLAAASCGQGVSAEQAAAVRALYTL